MTAFFSTFKRLISAASSAFKRSSKSGTVSASSLLSFSYIASVLVSVIIFLTPRIQDSHQTLSANASKRRQKCNRRQCRQLREHLRVLRCQTLRVWLCRYRSQRPLASPRWTYYRAGFARHRLRALRARRRAFASQLQLQELFVLFLHVQRQR